MAPYNGPIARLKTGRPSCQPPHVRSWQIGGFGRIMRHRHPPPAPLPEPHQVAGAASPEKDA